MDRPFRAAPEIFGKPKGIIDRLGKVGAGSGKVQIMGGARIKTLPDDRRAFAAINQGQYRNTAFRGCS